MALHPELESEQAYLAHAYACLDAMRIAAKQLQYSIQTGAGGTHQARFERDVTFDTALTRLQRLELGNESLCFGRIDRETGERFYVGRLPVSDAEQNPVIVDWRAPVSEAFYRATGRSPLGLVRRRHFSTDGPELVGIDDEVFSIEALERDDGRGLVGTGALLAALGRARSGHMRDIVATIQTEQDEIIRSELGGVLVVQGGPGTGKTAVALHRASYLLYTHRFPLERQGVLVVGPNRLFMRYISRVLPALGENGVELASVEDLFPGVIGSPGVDPPATVRIKGDARMPKVIRRAVTTRQRPLREPLVVGFGVAQLRITVEESAEAVDTVKRQHRLHNSGRRALQSMMIDRLYQRYREALRRISEAAEENAIVHADFAGTIRHDEAFRLALDRMWPLLTPQMLLRDLFGASALIKAAARDVLSEAEQRDLLRDRGDSVETVRWSVADVPLLDEAATLLGPVELRKPTPIGEIPTVHHDDPVRTFGHIVVDEAQDLSPMQLRMLTRRSLSGSMTIVGDIGQATGMWAPTSWDDVLAHLPRKRPARHVELTVGYRTPTEIMALAARVLAVAAPELTVPSSVRSVGYDPVFVAATATLPFPLAVTSAVHDAIESVGEGTVGVLCPQALVLEVREALGASGLPFDSSSNVAERSIDSGITVLDVARAKGLEFDAVVVVEPARIVRDMPQGLRSLYVALTRPTKTLTVVHAEPLPDCLVASD